MPRTQYRARGGAARREHGQGSIYQVKTGRHAGRWRAALRLPDGTRRYYLGNTRDEVAAKLDDDRHAVAHNVPLLPRQLTVASYLNDWLADRQAHLRPRTHESYGMLIRRYIAPSIGSKKLVDLTPPDVRRLHRELKAQG